MEGRKAPPEMRQIPTCIMEVTTLKKTLERLPHITKRFDMCICCGFVSLLCCYFSNRSLNTDAVWMFGQVLCCAAALTVLTVGCTKYCSSVSHLAQMESAVWTLMTGSILKEVCPPSLQIYILQNHSLSQFGPFGGQVHV